MYKECALAYEVVQDELQQGYWPQYKQAIFSLYFQYDAVLVSPISAQQKARNE
jgi:hypothetical protein